MLSAVLVGLLTVFSLGVGAVLTPRAVGVQLKGSRGHAYVVTSAAFIAITGAIIALGVYATHDSADWTPLFVAIGAFCVEGSVFFWILATILRGLMPKDGWP
jgi:hypothetical protein